MKNKIGKVDYSSLNNPPEKHERATAKYFAARGKDIVFICPHSMKGIRNPDFIMGGKTWEIKSPTTYSDSSFEYNLRKAMKQSSHIIFDLRRLNVQNEEKYTKGLNKWCKLPTIKTLLIITRDGRILTLKGKFDKI